MSRRRMVLVAVIAGLMAGCAAVGSTPVAPSTVAPVTVPGPDQRVTLFGTTVYRGSLSFEEALARQDAAYGPLEVVRVYFPGGPPPWQGSPAQVADRPVVVSFKLPPNEVIAGVHDAALAEWFSSIPKDQQVWWAYFHEPEDDIERGAFTATEFREAFRHVSALAKANASPNVQSALVLQCRTTKPQFGRNFADYDPGPDSYDVMGFDCYNREVRDGNYPRADTFLAPLLEVADRVGRPLGLAEFGSQVVPGDDGTARARWLEEVSVALIERRAPFVTYFDSPITGIDYRLEDEPSRAAWGQIVTGES